MADSWADIRHEFPALSHCTYLNAAASSPTPRCVRAAVEAFLRELETGGDVCWDEWLARRERVRATVAQLVGADESEIAFVPNTSAGINLIADLLDGDGDVISDTLEFPTVTLPWVHRGVPVHMVEPRAGVLDPADFVEPRCASAATLVVSHVQFSNGCRQDLRAFGALKGTRRLVVCASQSAGAFPIDVRANRIDALASAGHKWMCAGFGAGFMYVSRALLERPPRAIGWMSVQDPFRFDNRTCRLLPSASRYEMGCPPFGPIFALGAAARFLLDIGLETISARVLALNTYLTDCLAAAGVEVLSPGGRHRSGETLCRVPEPAAAVTFLRERGVHVTEKAEGVRVATHFYNTERDIDAGVGALREYVAGH